MGSKPYRKDDRGALGFHYEGGHALDNPDVQRLLADGHLGGMERRNWFGEQQVKRFRPINGHGAVGLPHPATTLLYLTPNGEEFFRLNRHLLRHELPYPLDRERYLWRNE